MSIENFAVIPRVISQHAEEAAFHWLLRDNAVVAAHYSLKDLAHLDNRVEAHLDGLRIAGDAGWEICCESLHWEDPGEVFTAAVLAYGADNGSRIETILEIVLTSPELARGAVSALGWLSWEDAEKHIRPMVFSSDLRLRRIGIAACAAHRQDPREALAECLTSENLLLRARALRATGQLGRNDLVRLVRQSLRIDDLMCRFSAAWTLALFGDPDVLDYLINLADADFPFRQAAMEMALRRMEAAAAIRWRDDLVSENRRADAVFAAGVVGDPGSIPWLIEQMAVPESARRAGESFTTITGVDIAYEDLEGEQADGFQAGPTESPEDEDVSMDPDEDLPWPDPELIGSWWSRHRGEFKSGTRYLLGKPITPPWLQEVLRVGRQRQRAAAALELAILERGKGQPLFEVRAPGFRQQKSLGLA